MNALLLTDCVAQILAEGRTLTARSVAARAGADPHRVEVLLRDLVRTGRLAIYDPTGTWFGGERPRRYGPVRRWTERDAEEAPREPLPGQRWLPIFDPEGQAGGEKPRPTPPSRPPEDPR